MAFKKATKQVAYARIGGFGPMGSGKTTLMALLALYLSKTYHGGAPVAFLDTEKGSDFVEPYFAAEGVELLVDKTRAFVDLRDAHAQALRSGACVLVADSLTHFWQELLRTVKGEGRHFNIKMIGEAKERWAEFTENYDRAPIHYLVAGRLGYDWENVDIEDEDGKITSELIKGGSKMKAEGDFSYEPDLVLELSSADDPDAADYKKLKKGNRIKKLASSQIHIANVKKCRVRALNGQMFSWPDKGSYKPGDYAKVGDCFKPYFDFLNIGGEHLAFDASRNSQQLMADAGKRDFFQQQRRREIACEEIKGSLSCVWSAATGKDAAVKTEVINALFGTLLDGRREDESRHSGRRREGLRSHEEPGHLADAAGPRSPAAAGEAGAIRDSRGAGKPPWRSRRDCSRSLDCQPAVAVLTTSFRREEWGPPGACAWRHGWRHAKYQTESA